VIGCFGWVFFCFATVAMLHGFDQNWLLFKEYVFVCINLYTLILSVNGGKR